MKKATHAGVVDGIRYVKTATEVSVPIQGTRRYTSVKGSYIRPEVADAAVKRYGHCVFVWQYRDTFEASNFFDGEGRVGHKVAYGNTLKEAIASLLAKKPPPFEAPEKWSFWDD